MWHLAEELDEAFQTRGENPRWFEGPLDSLERAAELLRVIDWPRTGPPVEADVDIDTWRAILMAGLMVELKVQHDHSGAPLGNGLELREEATQAVAIIEGFLAALPEIEAEGGAPKPGKCFTDPDGIERAVVLQVLLDDRAEGWSRAELETELPDVEALAISDALERLKAAAVVHLEGEQVQASRCARHLNTLGMVTI